MSSADALRPAGVQPSLLLLGQAAGTTEVARDRDRIQLVPDQVENAQQGMELAPQANTRTGGLALPSGRTTGVPTGGDQPTRVPPWDETQTQTPPARTDPLPNDRGTGIPTTGQGRDIPSDGTVPNGRTVPVDTTPAPDRSVPATPAPDRSVPGVPNGTPAPGRGLPSDRTVPAGQSVPVDASQAPSRTVPADRTSPTTEVPPQAPAPVESPRTQDTGLSTWDRIDNGISRVGRAIHSVTMSVSSGAGWLFSGLLWLVASPSLLFGVDGGDLWDGIRNFTRPVFAGVGGFFSGIFQLPTAAARVVLYFAQDLVSLKWARSLRGLGETLWGPVSGVVGMVLQPFTFAFREFVNERSEVRNENR